MEDVGRISDLPDSNLTHILSFLSTKEVVGTSILSFRWRYIFTLVPNLHFDLVDDFCHKNLESCILHIKSFISFVDKPLSLHEEIVHGRLVYSWISTAVRHGVKHLDISISPDQFTSPGTPLENLKSINSAFIQSAFSDFRNYATTLFRAISNVHSLLLLSCEPLPVFATLVELKICDYYREQSSCEYADLLINVKWSSSMDKGLEILLSSSPELEKLACHQTLNDSFLCCGFRKFSASCLKKRPIVMEILGFRNDKDVIEKAKYILKNGGALQKLTIRTLSNISKAKNLKMSEMLLGSPRESKHCYILIV
ncbi:hypothetical protein CXB51_000637 [Gossypium anomalum]|uniref:F-box domain-containing protein n=1 Tax=Gossypium anomalum TaxID=47600 RepID=A0A8J6D8V2_9ROSI|nr:hypothetical protein CXB51_000637 [Gossypium anomalum]